MEADAAAEAARTSRAERLDGEGGTVEGELSASSDEMDAWWLIDCCMLSAPPLPLLLLLLLPIRWAEGEAREESEDGGGMSLCDGMRDAIEVAPAAAPPSS